MKPREVRSTRGAAGRVPVTRLAARRAGPPPAPEAVPSWRPSEDDLFGFNMERWLFEISFFGDVLESDVGRKLVAAGLVTPRPHLPRLCGWRLYAWMVNQHIACASLAEQDMLELEDGQCPNAVVDVEKFGGVIGSLREMAELLMPACAGMRETLWGLSRRMISEVHRGSEFLSESIATAGRTPDPSGLTVSSWAKEANATAADAIDFARALHASGCTPALARALFDDGVRLPPDFEITFGPALRERATRQATAAAPPPHPPAVPDASQIGCWSGRREAELSPPFSKKELGAVLGMTNRNVGVWLSRFGAMKHTRQGFRVDLAAVPASDRAKLERHLRSTRRA